MKIIRNYISDSIKQLKEFEGYEIMTKTLSDELQSIENDIANRDRIVLLRLLQTIDNRINQNKTSEDTTKTDARLYCCTRECCARE